MIIFSVVTSVWGNINLKEGADCVSVKCPYVKDFINRVKEDIDNDMFYGTFIAVYCTKPIGKPRSKDIEIYGGSHESNVALLGLMKKLTSDQFKKAYKEELEKKRIK